MLKDVLITVASKKELEEGDNESISFVTEGTLSCVLETCEIKYNESTATGMEGTVTTIKVERDSVLLIREGTLNTMLIFEKGKTHTSGYETEYGTLQVGVTAQRIETNMKEFGGSINIEYMMDYNGAQGGKSSIQITVITKKDGKDNE